MPVATSTEAWLGIGAGVIGLATALVTLGASVIATRRQRAQVPGQRGLPSADELGLADDQRLVFLPARGEFVNRDAELAELLSRVSAGRENVVTIEGDRWVGKSAIASELAHALLSGEHETGFDPARRNFVWMDAHDSCPTLSEICGHLAGLTEDQSLTAVADEHKRDRLLLHLATTRAVLLLDNLCLDSTDDASRTLATFLHDVPGGALVIATINRPGTLVASRVSLRDLDMQHVTELVSERVRSLGLEGFEGLDSEFASELYEVIGGNPGVIEWFLRGYARSDQSLEERLRAVRAGTGLDELFGRAWSRLGPTCRQVLSVASYLRGEATARQLAAACALGAESVSDALDELRVDGLLTPIRAAGRPTVYLCSRAFQLFIASQLAPGARERFTDRLAGGFVDHFTAEPEDAAWAADEVHALRVVREELYASCDDARIERLFVSTLDVLFTLGQFDELIASADIAFRSAQRAQAPAAATLAAMIKSVTHAIRGEMVQARDALAHASLMAERAGDAGSRARAQRCMGFVLYRAGDAKGALAAIANADELAAASGDVVVVVDLLDLRAAACWHLGRLDDCGVAARASLEASASAGWVRARAYPVRFLAELAMQHREDAEARALVADAYAVAREYGDLRQEARVDLTRARIELFAGDLSAAADAANRAVAGAIRLGLPPEEREARATAVAIARARRSFFARRYYASRRPIHISDAPIGGD